LDAEHPHGGVLDVKPFAGQGNGQSVAVDLSPNGDEQ
jgi:hypothetical protein